MKTSFRLLIGLLTVISLALTASPASAWGRFGVRGPIGVHAGTHGTGVSLPTPEAGIGVDGPYGADAAVTADLNGVRAGVDGPYGTSAGVSSDGDAFVGANENLPYGGSVSGRAGTDGVDGDAGVEVPVALPYYSGI